MLEYADIQIDGKPYRTLVETRRKTDTVDFSPRATVPGGSIVQSELGLYQPLLQTNWQHGFGFNWYSDAFGYMRTEGNIDTRHEGIAMMMTAAVASETNANAKQGFTVFNGAVYAWGAAGLRKFASGSWSSVYSTAAVNFALALGSYLFFCPNGLRIQKIDTSGTITDAGVNSNSTDYLFMAVHNGYVYALKDGTNTVYYGSEPDLSDLHGDPADDTNEISIGAGGIPVIGVVRAFSRLFWARSDGLWELGDDRIARCVLNYENERSSLNFASMSEHNGFLVYPMRDTLFQWNGTRQIPITPPRLTDTFPYVTYGKFDNLVTVGGYLYLTARTNETTYTESLLCYDGVGWFKLMDLITDGDGSVTAMGFDTVNNRMWLHIAKAASHSTQYIQFQSESDFPYGNFPTSGTHSLISSRLDMGFRRVTKSMPSLLVEAANLAGNRSLDVYYSLDGGDWRLWRSITQNGVVELDMPADTETVEFKYIILRIDFITNTAAQSPILEGLTLRFLMRPDEGYGYSYDVIMGQDIQMEGMQDERTAAQMDADLEAARASKAPISFVDHLGRSHRAYLTSLSTSSIEEHIMSNDRYKNVEGVARVNLIIVKPRNRNGS